VPTFRDASAQKSVSPQKSTIQLERPPFDETMIEESYEQMHFDMQSQIMQQNSIIVDLAH
jgi:hypothetical protein